MEILLVLLGLVIYFLPAIIGYNTESGAGIMVLNLFLGWTVLGWIGALIWAVTAK
jgi:hypothetical protein